MLTPVQNSSVNTASPTPTVSSGDPFARIGIKLPENFGNASAAPSESASSGYASDNPAFKDTQNSAEAGITNYAKDVASNTVNEAKAGYEGLKKNIEQGASDFSQGKIPEGTFHSVVGTISNLGRMLFSPVTGEIQSTVKNTSNALAESPIVQKIANSKPVGGAIDAANSKLQALDQWAKANPEKANAIQDSLNTLMVAAGGAAAPEEVAAGKADLSAAKATIPDATAANESVMGHVKAAVDISKELPGNTINTVGKTANNVIGSIKDYIGNTVKGKSLEDVLSTPEDKLHTLSASERKTYFDNAQSQIKERSSNIENKVQQENTTRANALTDEATKLNRDLQVASRDEVLNMRPKIQQALGRQSQEYRRLVDEEISTKQDIPVKTSELRDYINGRYPENPEQAQAIVNRLGVGEEIHTEPKVGTRELPTISAEAPAEKATTIGNIYKQTLSMGQDIGSAAKKGTRVFTPGEKLTDDSISTLVDFMSEKGVDLSAARKFWAKYAPIRNQLVTEAKPFLQANTQTKTFANTLTRVARGTDVNNENFIKATENLLGERVGNKTRMTIAKLDANEKAQLANDLDSQTKKINARLESERQSKAMSDKEFEVNRQAKVRTAIKRTIQALTLYGADKYIKSKTGIGI